MRRLAALFAALACASTASLALAAATQDPSSATGGAPAAPLQKPEPKLERVGAAKTAQDPSGAGDAGANLAPVASHETDVRATAAFSRAEARIGDALELTIELDHPSNIVPELADPGEFAGPFAIVERGSRVLVDGGPARGASNGASSARASSSTGARPVDVGRLDGAPGANDVRRGDSTDLVRSRITLRVLALEGGDLESPPLEIAWNADGVPQRILVTPARVRVATALADGEDAPRPMRVFRDAPAVDPSASTERRLAAGAVLAALLVLAATLVARARGRRKVVVPPRSALEGLAALVALAQEPDADRRALVFALTKLVRAEVDARAGAAPGPVARRGAPTPAVARDARGAAAEGHAGDVAAAALPDEAWCALRTASPDQPGARALAALFAHVERIKYGGEVPSPLLWQDLVAQAREVLEALAAASSTRKEAA